MPQSNPTVIHVLLLWTTVLSIIQAAFIIFFFTAGHHGSQSHNNSAVTPESAGHSMANITPLPTPPDQESILTKSQMLTYKASEDKNGKFKWMAKNPKNSLVSEEGKDLEIKQDGYYFLNLQVKLKTCTMNESEHMVNLTWKSSSMLWKGSSKPGRVLLQGRINPSTCSTGLLGKSEELSAGGVLVFSAPTADIDDTESLTHLDIIFMVKS